MDWGKQNETKSASSRFDFFFFFGFLGPHLWHMEVPRLGVDSKLQRLCHNHSKLGSKPHLRPKPQFMVTPDPYPLSEARDWTRNLMVTSWIRFHCATTRMPASRFLTGFSSCLYGFTTEPLYYSGGYEVTPFSLKVYCKGKISSITENLKNQSFFSLQFSLPSFSIILWPWPRLQFHCFQSSSSAPSISEASHSLDK